MPGIFYVLQSPLKQDDKRPGGYFAIFKNDPHDLRPLALLQIENPDPQKLDKYLKLYCEKAWRLMEHPEHIASSQSANPEREQYGGAIRAGNYILVFTGMHTGELDEEILIRFAGLVDLISDSEFQRFYTHFNSP